jgi:hypothetical protein
VNDSGAPRRLGRGDAQRSEPNHSVTYRRTATVVSSGVISLLALGLAVAVSVRDGAAPLPLAVAALVVSLSVVSGVLPKLVTTPSQVRVHNMFVRLDLPYEAITEVVDSRRGLWLHTDSGRRIPVVAFGHSMLADLLTGDAAARTAAAALKSRCADRRPGAAPAPVRRHFSVPAIAAVAASSLAVLVSAL